MAESVVQPAHGLRRMRGRDIAERHRVASPLELLFDLVFAAAFGVAGSELSHGIVLGHAGPAILAFCFAIFGVVWAWINFSWFASAFDTDDWLFRLCTMLQMAGALILAIGLPAVFESLDEQGTFNNATMVAGYVVMRVAMVTQWLRAAREPTYRAAAKTYAFFILLAQIGWIITAVMPLPFWAFICAAIVLWAIELMGPIVAEFKGSRYGQSTPWHPHHIAERYSLLTIVTLGETVLGTLAAARMITDSDGWTFDSIAVIGIGIMMTFALWWQYFVIPAGDVLAAHRERAWVWGYGHTFVFLSIAGVGAGLHVVGYFYNDEHAVSKTVAVAALAIPVMLFSISLFGIYQWLVRAYRPVLLPQLMTFAMPVIGILLSGTDAPLWACLLCVLAGPMMVVAQYELGGWRSLEAQTARASDARS